MKNIPDNTNYFATEDGQIFSNCKGKIKEIKPHKTNQGYLRVCLRGKSYLVHRLVALTFIPNDEPERIHINHKNGIKNDNHVSNLEWVTPRENQLHAFNIGLKSNTGIDNPRAILTEQEVINIYKMLLNGYRDIDVVKDHNISKSCLQDIKFKRNWKEILNGFPDIKAQKRTGKLSENSVIWICELLQSGKGPQEILSMSRNPSITIDQISDIKRRKCFKHISDRYYW